MLSSVFIERLEKNSKEEVIEKSGLAQVIEHSKYKKKKKKEIYMAITNKRNIISFLNMKGGVGKTTLCRELAVFLYQIRQQSVLLIDIDPQSNCTQSLFDRHGIYSRYGIAEGEDKLIKREDSEKLPSIEYVFSKSKGYLSTNNTNNIIQNLDTTIINESKSAKLDIIPGHLDTIFMEREMCSGAAENRLNDFIDKYDLKNEYDYIFIDCPPTYSFYTIAAALSSDFYFVPVKPDAYSLLGLDLLERVMEDLKIGNRKHFEQQPIDNLGFIFTMVGDEKGYEKNIDQIKKSLRNRGIYSFQNEFPFYSKVSTGKLSKFIIDREDATLYEKLESICDEFEERVGKYNGSNGDS